MLKGHHGVCGERGEGRETGRLGIEQTSVAMSRHVAGDTDGRNSAGSMSFDCLQSPPPPSLAHRRRTGLGAAARRTVRVSQSCWGFRGLLDAGRESVPHLRRRPTPSRGPSAKYSEPTDEEFQAMLDERLPLPAKVLKEYWVTAACLAPLGHCPLTRRSFPEPSGTSNVGGR